MVQTEYEKMMKSLGKLSDKYTEFIFLAFPKQATIEDIMRQLR